MKKLLAYNFVIQYRKKSENSKINILSRKANHITDISQVNQIILQKNSDNFIVYNRQNTVTLRVYNKNLEKRTNQELVKNLVAQNIKKNIVKN